MQSLVDIATIPMGNACCVLIGEAVADLRTAAEGLLAHVDETSRTAYSSGPDLWNRKRSRSVFWKRCGPRSDSTCWRNTLLVTQAAEVEFADRATGSAGYRVACRCAGLELEPAGRGW